MSVFESVREHVSAEAAAIKYAGVRPVRRGKRTWALCPLHSDKNPSMLFQDDSGRFRCFGCGKSGDAADFVSLYYGIPAREAARLIAEDFGILERRETIAETRRKRELQQFDDSLSDIIRYCDDAIAATIRFWRFVKIRFSPKMPDAEFTDLFAKACRLLPEFEDLDERFRSAEPLEQAKIILEYQKEFAEWYAKFMPGGEAWDT